MIKEINGKIIFNVIGFYICWWLTIFGTSKGYYFTGPLSVVLFLVIHFYKVTNHKKEDLFLIICFPPMYIFMNVINLKFKEEKEEKIKKKK